MTDVAKLKALLELGWTYRKIGRELGLHRTTVARYDRERRSKPTNPIAGSVDLENRPNPIAGCEIEMPTSGPRSSAEVHHDVIVVGVKRGLSAQRIWQDLVEEHGFTGGYLIVQRYVRRMRRQRPEVADVMEHPPGKEAQIDFFRSPALALDEEGKWRRPWVFRMTLSCSRHGYEEGIWRQERKSFLTAQEHAFETFAGVPEIVRLDNTKVGVARACLYDPDVAEIYGAFAKHWGFVPLRSKPGHPQEQGIQERSGGYVKGNALKGRRFDSLRAHNEFLMSWNRRIAQNRIHGTTRHHVITHTSNRSRSRR